MSSSFPDVERWLRTFSETVRSTSQRSLSGASSEFVFPSGTVVGGDHCVG